MQSFGRWPVRAYASPMDSGARLKWWDTMRRAFDVSPKADDDAALTEIHEILTKGNGAYFGLDSRAAVVAMVAAVLDLAASGGLDDLLTVDADLYIDAAAEAHRAAYNLSHEEGWPALKGTEDAAAMVQLVQLHEETDKMVDRVVMYARDNP